MRRWITLLAALVSTFAAFADEQRVNDLDITVTVEEDTYYSGGKNIHNDFLNNCERVQLSDIPPNKKVEIKVSGYSVMEGPQSFALCVSGANAVPEPAFAFVALLITMLLIKKTR